MIIAHGISGRVDLPVPLDMFYWASAVVLVVSFVLLGGLWNTPRLEQLHVRPFPAGMRRALHSAAVVWLARLLVLAITLLAAAAAIFGSARTNENITPVLVFVVWWIGLVPLALLFGNVWRALNPWATIARLLRAPARTDRYPLGLGVWPAVALIAVWAWLELVYPTAADIRLLGWLIVAYSVLTVVAMLRFGVETWLDRGETFTVFSAAIATMSPVATVDLAADEDPEYTMSPLPGGRSAGPRSTPGLRPPFVGALRLQTPPGIVLFVTLLIGSVSFDGLSRSEWWKARSANGAQRLTEAGVSDDWSRIVFGTFGLVALSLLAWGAYELAAWAAQRFGRLPTPRASAAFAGSLLPIALAYAVAHYFSYFIFQSQDLIRLVSDPFGRGSDLFGTADSRIDYTLLSANLIWYVQVGAIVVGHVLGLMLAHERAVQLAPSKIAAIRSQLALLALMLLYTIGGLYFLSTGLSEA